MKGQGVDGELGRGVDLAKIWNEPRSGDAAIGAAGATAGGFVGAIGGDRKSVV